MPLQLPKTPLHEAADIDAGAESRAVSAGAILDSAGSSSPAVADSLKARRNKKDERLLETLAATGAPWWIARSQFPEAWDRLSPPGVRRLWEELASEKGLAAALATYLWLNLAFGRGSIRASEFSAVWSTQPVNELSLAWRDTATHQAVWAQAVADSERLVASPLELKNAEQNPGVSTAKWTSVKDTAAGIIPREKDIQRNTEKRLREGIECIEKLRASPNIGGAALSVIEEWARARTGGKHKPGANEIDRRASQAGAWSGLAGSQMQEECQGEESRVARWIVAGQMFHLKGLGIGSFAKIVNPAILDQEIVKLAAQKFVDWVALGPQEEAEAPFESEDGLRAAAIVGDLGEQELWSKNANPHAGASVVIVGAQLGESVSASSNAARAATFVLDGGGQSAEPSPEILGSDGKKPSEEERAALRAAKYAGTVAHCDLGGMVALANIACGNATRAPLFQKALRATGVLASKDAVLRLANLSGAMGERQKMGWLAGLSLAASDQKDAAGNPVSVLCAPGMEAVWLMRWEKFADSCENAPVSVQIWADADHATRCLSNPAITKAKNRAKEKFTVNQQATFAGVEARELRSVAEVTAGPSKNEALDPASEQSPSSTLSPPCLTEPSHEQKRVAKRQPRRV